MPKPAVHVVIGALILLAVGQAALGESLSSIDAALTFTTPTGTVGTTDSIPVWLTLLLGPSYSLATDAAGNVTSGFNPSDVASHFSEAFSVNDSFSVYLNVNFGCSGTFTSGCLDGPPYDFGWNFGGGPLSLSNAANLNVPAGSSIDYLLGTFVPTGGAAPPGTYQFFNTGVFMEVYDQSINESASVDIASTGWDGPGFTRDVIGDPSATPEPGTYGLMLAGFGVLAAFVRRRA